MSRLRPSQMPQYVVKPQNVAATPIPDAAVCCETAECRGYAHRYAILFLLYRII